MQKKVNLKMISVSTVLLICTVIGTIFVLHKSPETEKSLTIHFKWNESAPYLYYETEDGEDSTAQVVLIREFQ